MKRIILILLLCTPALLRGSSVPGADCSSCTIYRSYINGDMEIWKKGMAELEEKFCRESSPCTFYTLAEARYGYIG